MNSLFANTLKAPKFLTSLLIVFSLTACGGGGGGGGTTTPPPPPPPPPTPPISISGGGIKGPLTNAIVTVSAFDATASGFAGSVIDTGTTDDTSAITGLDLPVPTTAPYLFEVSADTNTIDLTTGVAPILSSMRTVITQQMLDDGVAVYATPLTELAVSLAISNADSSTAPWTGNADGTTSSTEFTNALSVAANIVLSTIGFGSDTRVDIFATPPLINSETDTAEEQASVAAYRSAIEATAAILYEIAQQTAETTPEDVLLELAADLADDNRINGSAGGILNPNSLEIFDQDPGLLQIPNSPTGQTVGDVQTILDSETNTTGSTTVTIGLTDGTIVTVVLPGQPNPDSDGDGTFNNEDDFPNNPNETTDTDGDGIGDNTDPDDDGDGILDEDETSDTITTTDTDSDGDSINNDVDNCPANFNTNQTDTDGDGEGDACDLDDDNDSFDDVDDAFPLDESESVDTDQDGVGNNADTDDDDDGLLDSDETGVGIDGVTSCSLIEDCDEDGTFDASDDFPADASEQRDTDGDGTGNNADTDDDNDGVSDIDEQTNGTRPLVADSDSDGLNDGEERDLGTDPNNPDTDGDTVNDNGDAFPTDPSETVDTDNDGVGDNGDAFPTDPSETADTDNDGVGDNADAFPSDPSESVDTDNDGVGDNGDAFPTDPSETADTDSDGVGDNGDVFPTDPAETLDADADGVGDNGDVCPATYDPLQINTDGLNDGGDACDNDDDEDSILDDVDNCPINANTDQADADNNGIGDVCENTAPVINSVAITDVLEDDLYSYGITATDAESDAISLTASGLPLWLSLVVDSTQPAGSAAGTLSGTPVNEDVGSYPIAITATSNGVSTNQAFTVVVTNVNDAPVIVSNALTTALSVGDSFQYTIIVSDVDVGDSFTAQVTNLPSWLSFNSTTNSIESNTGAVAGNFYDNFDYKVEIKVRDSVLGSPSDTQILNFVVSDDIVKNASDLVGSWKSMSGGMTHFFANGYYEASGPCSEFINGMQTSIKGMSYGTYSINTTSGFIATNTTVATDSICSLGILADRGSVLTLNGDNLKLFVLEDGGVLDIMVVDYNRVSGGSLYSSSIEGSWLAGNIEDAGEGHSIVSFINSFATLSQNCATDGIAGYEYGDYFWVEQTNVLNITVFHNDTNGSCGFGSFNTNDASGNISAIVANNALTLDGKAYTRLTEKAWLDCFYESGWDDTADGGIGAPINPNSFADYEGAIKSCGGAQSITASDIKGKTFTEDNGDGEKTVFANTSAAGTSDDRGTGQVIATDITLNFEWYVEAATCTGCTHDYIVIYVDPSIDVQLNDFGVSFIRDTRAITSVNGITNILKIYSEQSNYSDADRSTGSDGEIWNVSTSVSP